MSPRRSAWVCPAIPDARADSRALAAVESRRRTGWAVRSVQRPGQSARRDHGAHQGCQAGWGASLREHAGTGCPGQGRQSAGRADGAGRHRLRARAAGRRHVDSRHSPRSWACRSLCTRQSTTTSSRKACLAWRATPQCLPWPTSGPTTRRTPANCWWASSRRRAIRGPRPVPTFLRDFSFEELAPNMEHMEPQLLLAFDRVPVLQTTGIQLFFCGPESFTPDGRAYMGPAADVRGLYIAAGFNSNGILSSGGAGKVMARLAARRLALGEHGRVACAARAAVPGEHALCSGAGGRVHRHPHDLALARPPRAHRARGAPLSPSRPPHCRRCSDGRAHRLGVPALLR